MHHIQSVSVPTGHRLRLRFDDGAEGEVDLATYLRFDGVMAPLRDPDYVRRVRVDPESRTVCWPNGVDLDPDALYAAAIGGPLPGHTRRLPAGGALTRSAAALVSPAPSAPEAETGVPEISRFLGIVIQMFFTDHQPPHFRVTYGEQQAAVEIASLGILDGRLSGRVLGLVVEWAASHHDELFDNWERARRHEPLRKIAPLE